MPRGVSLRTWNPVWRRRALWGGLALVLLVASLVASMQAGRVRTHLIAETTASTSALVHAALGPELTTEDTYAPATGARYVELTTVVRRQLLADGTVEAVTVWSPGGTILFADDVRLVGQEVRSMRTTVLAVIGDAARSDVVRGIVRTFVPLEVGGGAAVAVEIDRSSDPIRAASDPWRLMGLVAAAGALLSSLLVVRSFTRYGRRAEGFDEDALRAAVVARRRAEHDRTAAEERRDQLEAELERAREELRQAQTQAREEAKAAADTPRLRDHLASTAEDLRRSEEEVVALTTQLAQVEAAVEALSERDRAEIAAATAEIERLQDERATVADRAAKAEEAVARLSARVEELQARPDVETELASSHQEAEAARQALEAERTRAALTERRTRELEREAIDLQERLRDLERRPDLSARMDAAGEALDIAREQIRALTARADEAGAEAKALRAGADRRLVALSEVLDETRATLTATQGELEVARGELRSTEAENEALHHEVESLRRQTDAAGALLAGEKAELTQAAEQMRALSARAEEAEAIRAGLEAANAELARLRDEREMLQADLSESQRHAAAAAEASGRRIADLEVEIARIADLELQLTDARERAERVERELADAEARTDKSGGEQTQIQTRLLSIPSVGVDGGSFVAGTEPVAPGFEPASPNGRRPPAGIATPVEVDALVRRLVRETWSDRGRMVSIYAEPVTVEAEPGRIDGILGAMLERSLERTIVGNRLVVHVERSNDGALLSVEDGRPATDDAMSPEARRLAVLGGGWAAVEDHPGGGAIFRVWVPPTAPVTGAVRPAHSEAG